MACGRYLLTALLFAARAQAQTPELDRARATFTEALADQEAGHADVALAKFRRVAEVRDTSQVEYRIGACLEALGQRRRALVAYDRSVRLGRGDAHAEDVVASANEHIATLASSMGKLALVTDSASQLDVRVDGEVISADELHAPLLLEPGQHTVDVTAAGKKPTHANVVLERAQRINLTVALADDETPSPPLPPSHTRRDVGIVFLGTAGAFAIGTGLSLWGRQNTIDIIKTDCPGDTCAISRQSEIEGLRSTANALGPVAIALGSAAVVAAGVGIVLVALGARRTSALLVPGGFTFAGTF